MWCNTLQAAKARGKPYTIVFVGVNGVGKSTNLAKVAYWLLQNDISVGSLGPAAAATTLSYPVRQTVLHALACLDAGSHHSIALRAVNIV